MFYTVNYEILYLRNICQIQSELIDEKISRQEYDQKMEIERLKYIDYLQKQNSSIVLDMKQETMSENIKRKLNREEK